MPVELVIAHFIQVRICVIEPLKVLEVIFAPTVITVIIIVVIIELKSFISGRLRRRLWFLLGGGNWCGLIESGEGAALGGFSIRCLRLDVRNVRWRRNTPLILVVRHVQKFVRVKIATFFLIIVLLVVLWLSRCLLVLLAKVFDAWQLRP